MIMQTEELWRSIENDAATGRSGIGGWLLRLARPDAACPLFLGIELSSRRRAIMLRLPQASLPSRRLWPRSKGLESFAVALDNNPHFGVCLKETRYADVFTALTEDLVRRVTEAGNPAAQAKAFLGQLTRWQKFLSAPSDGLGEEAQRGLWGELRLLREVLLPAFGTGTVQSWKGGERAHQDFQMSSGAIEVKTTLAKKPQVVRITSERQLDDSTLPVLFLSVLSLDLREGGETLPALVGSVREKLAGDASARESFEDGLLETGYMDAHAGRYESGYSVRTMSFFRIAPEFPRIVESDLPAGTGDANYALDVSACDPFRITQEEMIAVLSVAGESAKSRRKHV
jgi:hypothetical protein